MLSTTGRTAVVHDLHRKSTRRQGIEELSDGTSLPLCNTLMLLVYLPQRFLDHRPDIVSDGLQTQEICENPVHTCGEFGHTIPEAACDHRGRRFAENLGIGKDDGGCCTGKGLLETPDRNGSPVRGIAVNTRGGGDHHVGTIELRGCSLGDVIEGARAKYNGNTGIHLEAQPHLGDGVFIRIGLRIGGEDKLPHFNARLLKASGNGKPRHPLGVSVCNQESGRATERLDKDRADFLQGPILYQ
ncbi:hypothetical protein SDC9_150734 [bioreactor metagenome]|uniref:Uncharacterized protein n=1 Tax=bioreactor metagenome TaxID=1076179 RepID=A0A645ESM1_9ZZZZ